MRREYRRVLRHPRPLGENRRPKPHYIEAVSSTRQVRRLQRPGSTRGLPCGYPQSGKIMSAAGVARRHADEAERADIDAAMPVTSRRCGTYQRIRAAIHAPRAERGFASLLIRCTSRSPRFPQSGCRRRRRLYKYAHAARPHRTGRTTASPIFARTPSSVSSVMGAPGRGHAMCRDGPGHHTAMRCVGRRWRSVWTRFRSSTAAPNDARRLPIRFSTMRNGPLGLDQRFWKPCARPVR